MAGSKPRRTTKSSSMVAGSGSTSQRKWVGPSNPRWARDGRVVPGQQFGSWTVLSDAPFQMYGALYVRARCRCGREKDVNLLFMETGRSAQCKGCATRARHHRNGRLVVDTLEIKLLQKRVNAMRQRCCNPKDAAYHNYGGRGIEFRFSSVRAGVEYILSSLPVPTYVGLEINRLDNNGHYEPGNLGLCTRQENLANRRPMICLTPDLERALVLGLALLATASTGPARPPS